MIQLEQHIEALIFASDHSISINEIKTVIDLIYEVDVSLSEIEHTINTIKGKYADPKLAIELSNINNGFQFLTKPAYYKVINQLKLQRSNKKLSQAALETLAIIAYRQPITKLKIEEIRGVNCDYTVQKLLEKDLITISGKADTVGKPILYSTSDLFMDYFGINSTADLPQLKDMTSETNEIGMEDESI
ncbi:MAG TPA: SMC-Scp complex subunit ScpB [Sphingobacteriaceae bacterium]|nr:SMC-Scp complex subunit ScpB [Sphingobacteriaceae bacterium]